MFELLVGRCEHPIEERLDEVAHELSINNWQQVIRFILCCWDVRFNTAWRRCISLLFDLFMLNMDPYMKALVWALE